MEPHIYPDESNVSAIREIKAKHDIRHSLAIDRTVLANERTLLSYTRTSLTMLVPGVSFVHFTEAGGLHLLGWLFIPLGLFSFIYGYFRFNKRKLLIRHEKEALQQMLRNEYCNIV
jgi:putative membrane protein